MSNKLIQMKLDFGQKEFGIKKCKTCGMVYTVGDEDDIKAHDKFHKTTLKISKYKKENIVEDYFGGDSIIQLDIQSQTGKKTLDLVSLKMNEELGGENLIQDTNQYLKPNIKVFLYIHLKNQIVGCCIAEVINEASKIIPDRFGVVSVRKTSALCGIQKIWVDKQFRRKGIATAMVDASRKNLIFSFVVPIDKVAFTAPTDDGKNFAQKYCQKEAFLVY